MKKLHNFRKISFLVFSLSSLLLISFAYRGLFRTFYQQDEWMGMGQFMANGFIGTLQGVPLSQILTGAGRPLVIPIHYLFYHVFPFQVWPFALFSIAMHTLNSIAVYTIALLLMNSLIAAWVAGLFFAVSYNGSQAVSWFGASTTTLPSALFTFLSILLFFKYIRNNKQSYFLFWSQLCVITSFFFKESGITMVIFLPALYAIYLKGKSVIKRVMLSFMPLIAYFSFVVTVLLIRLLTPSQQVGKFVGQSSGGMLKIIENAIYYPILSFSQVFIPMSILQKVSVSLRYVNTTADMVFFGLSLVLLFCIAITWIIWKKRRKEISVASIFMLLSFVPFAVLERGASYLDSRYFYVGMAGGGILLGAYGSILWNRIRQSPQILRNLSCFVGIVILGSYVYKNVQFTKRDIRSLELDSQERILILKQVKGLYPVLPKNPVFYVTGDHGGYYFVKNQKMPFQQGIGYTLMAWYFPTGNISKNILKLREASLWDIYSQGFVEVQGSGFGYYWDKDVMRTDIIKAKRFAKNQIIGLYYHSGAKQVEDISQRIQEQMPE